jgi:steroid 5-alpha reductase family enzyme
MAFEVLSSIHMQPFLIALACLFVYMCFAFVVSLIRKDNGTADIAYGYGFFVVAWVTYFLGSSSWPALIASCLVTIWAVRLSVRIYLRSRGKPEDFRYKKWRDEWGKAFVLRSFLQVYLLQGAVIYLVSIPIMLLNTFNGNTPLGSVAISGIVIWLIGFFFEAVGDYQLAMFMRNPANKGKVMDRGLWKYTRHPNYFGESTMWWGLALISFGTLVMTQAIGLALAAFVGPIIITFLLLKVSGVPLLEAHFAGNPEWEKYKAKTSVFIPWFSKKSS